VNRDELGLIERVLVVAIVLGGVGGLLFDVVRHGW
jgi:hypothetical protein